MHAIGLPASSRAAWGRLLAGCGRADAQPPPLITRPTAPTTAPTGLGLKPAEEALALLAPPLDRGEEVYLASLLELAAGLLGEKKG